MFNSATFFSKDQTGQEQINGLCGYKNEEPAFAIKLDSINSSEVPPDFMLIFCDHELFILARGYKGLH